MKQQSPNTPTPRDRQRGAALLVVMLIFFLASMSMLLNSVNISGSRAKADQISSDALAQAKAALLARAATTPTRPGSLPCPDFVDDGEATGSCASSVGRLPWKTLGLSDLRDGDGNRLWYVIASELRNNSTAKINPAESLGLTMDGTANIAAIVFSPGPPLAGQNGRLSNNVKDYLDGTNNEGGPYISGPASSAFNDRAVTLSRDELFSLVNHRILGLLGVDLETYYANNSNLYPDSDTELKTALNALVGKLALASKTDEKTALEKRIAMIDENGWFAVTSYLPSPDRQTATLAITVPPTVTCTLAHAQRLVCTQS